MKKVVTSATPLLTLTPELYRIIEARHHDPFSVLGRHPQGQKTVAVRAFLPKTQEARIADTDITLQRIPNTDLFVWQGPAESVPYLYRIERINDQGHQVSRHDPYCFAPQLGDLDLHLFGEGRHWHAYRFLGAHPRTIEGIDGVLFAVWAPNADRVSVVGDFNDWDGRTHPMRVRGGSGIWELFIPDIAAGMFYKFEIRSKAGQLLTKTDPYGQCFQMRPETAAVILDDTNWTWNDEQWMTERASRNWNHAPMSVYEVHLGSWRRDERNGFLNYRELATQLGAHVKALGFTHVELLPVSEHPLDDSWGYQATGYFAPTSRFGSPDDFRWFVDHLHQQGIGVLVDWVPAHFPKDSYALAHFDGSALYEHADPRLGEHQDWGTLIFNYGRNEVKNFLLASAIYWLEEFHIDGLRVDAVASMLYLDYSRQEGQWIPNRYGGRENLDAVDFLRQLNAVTHDLHPGTLMIAEESTSWPLVSRPTYLGGLGFSMKWNMGWMHDTLEYMSRDPVYRHYHHELLTFGLLYAFHENFVLPFSHDEVVHGKRSLLDKMPGDSWQRFANLRLLYTYLFTYPGKKLLFMGAEFGQGHEWNFRQGLDWYLLDRPQHQGVQHLIADLNRAYRDLPALCEVDFHFDGFSWVDCHDHDQSVLTYLRKGKDPEDCAVVVLNFTPVPRHNYRIGLPYAGSYQEIINSDADWYGGSNIGNSGLVHSEPSPWMNYPHSVAISLPPLAGMVFSYQRDQH